MKAQEISLKMKKLHATHFYAMQGDITFSIYRYEEDGYKYWKAIIKMWDEECDSSSIRHGNLVYRSVYPGIRVLFEKDALSRHQALKEINDFCLDNEEMQRTLMLMRKEELEQQLKDLYVELQQESEKAYELRVDIEEINQELKN
jgi:hypothetical protein